MAAPEMIISSRAVISTDKKSALGECSYLSLVSSINCLIILPPLNWKMLRVMLRVIKAIG